MYKRNHNSESITRISDGASIPTDPANSDYARFLVDVETDPTCVVDADPPTNEETNAQIVAQIVALEAGQARAVREAALGVSGAKARLQSLDNQIKALRDTLL